MNLDFTNGTDQQQQWVNDAVASCTYPFNTLRVDVLVEFVDPLPVSPDIGHLHSYMVTIGGTGSYTIYVAPWADDPNNPNNLGLPSPPADIFDFFKQSIVHELGHVTAFELLHTDALRTRAAAQFYTAAHSGGTGIRYGVLSDYDGSVWIDNMKEAIAEVFKCTFYVGRLIYGNRTSWAIDAGPFDVLMAMLVPQGSTVAFGDALAADDRHIVSDSTFSGLWHGIDYRVIFETYDPADLSPTSITTQTLKLEDRGSNDGELIGLATARVGADYPMAAASLLVSNPQDGGGVVYTTGDLEQGKAGICVVAVGPDQDRSPDNLVEVMQLDYTPHDSFRPMFALRYTESPFAAVMFGSPSLPCWLRLVTGPTAVSAELWESDPEWGGGPSQSVTVETDIMGDGPTRPVAVVGVVVSVT